MKLVLLQRDVGLVNRFMPTLTTLVCVFVSVIPVHLPGFAVVTPAFPLMAVYHWSMYRPELLPFVAVFAAGLLLDLLTGAPLGVSSLVLLMTRVLVLTQRQHFVGRGFVLVWAGFVAVVSAAVAFEWAVVNLVYGMLLDIRPFLFQGVLTIATYPVISYLLVRVQRNLLVRV
jgi:rod shape-determining protein MreD